MFNCFNFENNQNTDATFAPATNFAFFSLLSYLVAVIITVAFFIVVQLSNIFDSLVTKFFNLVKSKNRLFSF